MLVSYVFTIVVLSCVTNVDCVPCNSTSNKPFIITPTTQLVSLGDTNVQIHCAAEPNEMWSVEVVHAAATPKPTSGFRWKTMPHYRPVGVLPFSVYGSLLIPSITSLSITNYYCFRSGPPYRASPLATIYPAQVPSPKRNAVQMGVLGQWSLVNDSRFVVSVSSVTVMGAKGTDDGMYLINGTNGFSSNQLAFRVECLRLRCANSKHAIRHHHQATEPANISDCSGPVPSPPSHRVQRPMIDSNLSITWTREGQAVSQDSTHLCTQSLPGQRGICPSLPVHAEEPNWSIHMYCLEQQRKWFIFYLRVRVSDVSSMSQEGVVTLVWTPPTPGPFEISYTVYYGLVNSSMNYGPSQTVKFYVQPDTGLPVVINAVIAGAIILAVLVAIAIMCLGAFLYIRRQRAYQLSSNNWMIYDEKPQTSSAVELVPSITLPSNGDIAASLHEQDYLSNEDEVDPKWGVSPRGASVH
eukprot:Em0013g883a